MSQSLIDTKEYVDLDIIKGNDGYITPNATFLIIRNSNTYNIDKTHENWSKKYVREKEWYHVFADSIYNKESDFLEKGLKYIRYANMDVITNSLKGNDLWELYKDYENGDYAEDQLEFLKEVCAINALEFGISVEERKK